MRRVLLLFVVTGVLGSGREARAQQSGYFGGEEAMTAASGMALARGGGAAWYNPAGLGGLQRSQLDLSGTVFLLRLRPLKGALIIDLPSGSYDANPNANQITALPAALVFTRGLSDRVTMGLGIFVTSLDQYAISTTLDREEVDPQSGASFRYIQRSTVDHQAQTYHIGPVIGWKVNRCFRLGWSLFAVYTRVKDSFSLVMEAHSLEADPPEIRVSQNEDYRYSGWDIGIQAAMGLQWEVAPGWHLGLLVRTPTMAFWHSGRLSALSSLLQASQADGHEGHFQLTEPSDQGAGFSLVAPALITAGLAYRHPRFWIGVEGDFVLPLKNEDAAVDVPFQWNLRAGSRVVINPRWSVGLGGFTDRTLKTVPAFPTDSVMDYYGFTAGFEWRRIHRVVGRPRPDGLIFATTVALRYAIGIGDISTFRNGTREEGAEFGIGSTRFHEVGIYIGSTVYF